MYEAVYVETRTVWAIVGTIAYIACFLIISDHAIQTLEDRWPERRVFWLCFALLAVCLLSAAVVFMLVNTGAI